MLQSQRFPKAKRTPLTGIKEAVQDVANQPRHSAVTSAISKVAHQGRSRIAIESLSPKQSPTKKAFVVSQSTDPKYQPSTPNSNSTKNNTASLDSIISKEAPLVPPQALEEVALGTLASQPPNLESAATDIQGAYLSQTKNKGAGDDPASFYRNLSGNPASPGGEGSQGFDSRNESAGPLQTYANRQVYQTRTDAATGQKIATLGNEELSLTGAIQKFYQKQ